MKEYLPEACVFVENNIKELEIINTFQINLEGYIFNINNNVQVYDMKISKSKKISEHTIIQCDYFSDDVKEAIEKIRSLLPNNGYINIDPDRIRIGYKFDESEFTRMLICNYSFVVDNSSDSYSEPLYDKWHANIFYTPKG